MSLRTRLSLKVWDGDYDGGILLSDRLSAEWSSIGAERGSLGTSNCGDSFKFDGSQRCGGCST